MSAEVQTFKQFIEGLPNLTDANSSMKMIALANGVVTSLSPDVLQKNALNPIKSVNLDTDKICGIFDLSHCSGTPPGDSKYGMVLKIGAGSDWFMLVITSRSQLFIRADLNNKIGTWKLVGGGKTLHFYRNNAERRVAA